MAFAPSPTTSSVISESNFSFSTSDIANLHMSDNYSKPAPNEKAVTFEKEGSFEKLDDNNYCKPFTALLCSIHCFIQTNSLFTDRQYPLSPWFSKESRGLWRPSLPLPRPTQSTSKTLQPPSLEPCGDFSMKGKSPPYAIIPRLHFKDVWRLQVLHCRMDGFTLHC